MKLHETLAIALLTIAPAYCLGADPKGTTGPPAAADAGLDPSLLSRPPINTWPTYNGDYSGRPVQYAPPRSTTKT